MSCDRLDSVRDYAFDELALGARAELEKHVLSCFECADELRGLQFTTAALHTLPDREIPQRIAFVSDKVFAPSPVARFFGGFWNSAAKVGFASACLLAGAITYSAAPASDGDSHGGAGGSRRLCNRQAIRSRLGRDGAGCRSEGARSRMRRTRRRRWPAWSRSTKRSSGRCWCRSMKTCR